VVVYAGIIAELRPFYAGTMGHVSAALVGLLGICVFAQWFTARGAPDRSKLPLGEIIWLAGSAVLLMAMGRMSPVFAIIAGPAFAATLPGLSDRLLARGSVVALLAVVLAASAWSVASGFPSSSQSLSSWLDRHGPDLPCYPCGAADFVQEHVTPSTGRLICEFNWGGYLEWRLGHRFQELMDGRAQVFSNDFWNTTLFGSAEQCRRYFVATPADAAIVPKRTGKFEQTLSELGYVVVYEDDYAKVMVPMGETRMTKPETRIKSE
jgi:hypothetical protein